MVSLNKDSTKWVFSKKPKTHIIKTGSIMHTKWICNFPEKEKYLYKEFKMGNMKISLVNLYFMYFYLFYFYMLKHDLIKYQGFIFID